MKKLLLLALVVPACVVGSDGQSPTPGDDVVDPVDPPPGISGRISQDTVLTGENLISGATIVDPGITLTVMAGSTLNFAKVANLTVEGTLDVQGIKGSEVRIQLDPTETLPANFGSITVKGTATVAYAIQSGGSMVTNAGGTLTITDTKMFGASGDFLIMSGGILNVTYSQIGADIGTPDSTHCNLHFGGLGNQISITKSNIIGTPYGLMFYGGTGAIFTENNWEQGLNATPTYWIDSQAAVAGDFSLGYFGDPAILPTPRAGATLTVDNPSLTRLIDAGVR